MVFLLGQVSGKALTAGLRDAVHPRLTDSGSFRRFPKIGLGLALEKREPPFAVGSRHNVQ